MTFKDTLWNTVICTMIAGVLGYAAFGSGWHGALFGFFGFLVCAQGNRIATELTRNSASKADGHPEGALHKFN